MINEIYISGRRVSFTPQLTDFAFISYRGKLSHDRWFGLLLACLKAHSPPSCPCTGNPDWDRTISTPSSVVAQSLLCPVM